MGLPELTVDRMLELAYGQAKNLIIGNKEQILPVFMLLAGDDTIVFVGCPWQGEDQKDMAIVMLRELMKEHKATAYSFLTEAWVARQPKGWRPGIDPTGAAPMDRPDRKEVVLAMATNGTHTQYKSWDIVRDADGNCMDLVEVKMAKFALGRFEGLLPSNPTQ
jgi:hypothetical protein